MPFGAECRRCGYFVFEKKRKFLIDAMDCHDYHSHKSESGKWVIFNIKDDDFALIEQLQKLPEFWHDLRNARKIAMSITK